MAPADDTRTRILDSALELFYERGYKGATTRAIAELADVNEVTLFRTFGSKENIFLEVIARETDIMEDLEEFDLEPSGDLEVDMTAAGLHIVENMVSRAKLVKIIMTEAAVNPRVWESVSHAPFSVLARITRYFDEAKERGYIRDVDTRVVAIGYFSFFFRTLIANAFIGQDVFLEMDEEAIRKFVNLYVEGIST